jgi:hypothetical protein
MKVLVALAVGYVLGARTAPEDFDEIIRSLRALRETDEFHDVLAGLRSHAAHTLRELATVVESAGHGSSDPASASTTDLVERVRHLVGLR